MRSAGSKRQRAASRHSPRTHSDIDPPSDRKRPRAARGAPVSEEAERPGLGPIPGSRATCKACLNPKWNILHTCLSVPKKPLRLSSFICEDDELAPSESPAPSPTLSPSRATPRKARKRDGSLSSSSCSRSHSPSCSSPRPMVAVRHERFDLVLPNEKEQIIAMLLSPEGQRGWPTAVAKHGLAEWLHGTAEGERKRELKCRWLTHASWHCVYIQAGEQVIGAALLGESHSCACARSASSRE